MHKDVNFIFIALITQVIEANSFDKFHPISLYNFLYKIVLKVMANWLKSILLLIISPNQGGFISGRQILDGIVLAHELTHSTFKFGRDGMLLKFDISKAYDKVDWKFLMLLLHKFGFQED